MTACHARLAISGQASGNVVKSGLLNEAFSWLAGIVRHAIAANKFTLKWSMANWEVQKPYLFLLYEF